MTYDNWMEMPPCQHEKSRLSLQAFSSFDVPLLVGIKYSFDLCYSDGLKSSQALDLVSKMFFSSVKGSMCGLVSG